MTQQFAILNLDANAFWPNNDAPTLYCTGADAAEIARRLTSETGAKFQCRPYVKAGEEDAWKAREQARLDSGEYIKLAWATSESEFSEVRHLFYGEGALHRDLFAHVAVKDGGRVAYTVSEETGRADSQTSVRIRVFLARFCEHVSEETRERIAIAHEKLYAPREVLFAVTPEHILAVYQQGPRSCMGGKRDGDDDETGRHKWAWDDNPTRCYGAGDLHCAYLLAKGSPDFDAANPRSLAFRVTARCIVRPEKMAYGRVYPNRYDGGELPAAEKLRAELESLGYRHDYDSFYGARLLKIRGGRCGANEVLLPYIDGITAVADDGEFLVLDEEGEYSATDTGGRVYLGGRSSRCCSCNERVSRDYQYTYEGETYCESCYSERVSYCEYCESERDSDSFHEVHLTRRGRATTEYICEHCHNESASRCYDCNESWLDESLIESEHDGESRCPDCNEAYEAELEREREREESLETREPSPTINDARQESFVLMPPVPRAPVSVALYEVICYCRRTGASLGRVALNDEPGDSDTWALPYDEAIARAEYFTRLHGRHYTYVTQLVQGESSLTIGRRVPVEPLPHGEAIAALESEMESAL